jgi:hypothetical protein
MKTLISFVGKLGSGKNHCMNKMVDELKDTGHTIYLVSFADPIKKILRDSFGLTKAGKLPTKHPEFTELYVKSQVVDSLYSLIRQLNYEKFDITESDLKSYIARNYEIHEKEFYKWVCGATRGYFLTMCPTENWKDNTPEYALCFRKLGQMLGTELARHIVDSIWVDLALNKVKNVFKNNMADYAFIADCRFLNEYEMLQKFRQDTAFDSLIYGVVATDQTRAKRRNMTIEELYAQDDHGSEQEVDSIIRKLPLSYVINNDKDTL